MNRLKELEEKLEYSFGDIDLLKKALTHSSRAYELSGNYLDCNERLEFLGDAVLEQLISAKLYKELPSKTEGELSKLRAAIVCERSLADAARKKDIPAFIYLGKGEELSGGRTKDSIISDCFEAILGAVFLDGGMEPAQKYVDLMLTETIKEAKAGRLYHDTKSALQEYLQKKGSADISYTITGESGPAHAKVFEASVSAGGRELGRGCGRTKQAAQSEAAAMALALLHSEETDVL